MSRQEVELFRCYNHHNRWFTYMLLEARLRNFPVCDCCKDGYRDAVPYFKRFVKARMSAHLSRDPSWRVKEEEMFEIGGELVCLRDDLDLSDEETARLLKADPGEIHAFDMGFLLEENYPYPEFKDEYIGLVRKMAAERGIDNSR